MATRKDKPGRRESPKRPVAATAAGAPGGMPMGKIGNLKISRMIGGCNQISMNMHARDLKYINDLATHYNTEERILKTLKLCEEHGINAIVLKKHNFERFRLNKHWDQRGGKMLWIADVMTRDIKEYERLLVEHLELGASAAYLWGSATDAWYHQKKQADIVKAFEIMKKYDVPVGIGSHRLEPVAFCEKEGLKPDFYMLAFHHDRYWSAHPKKNRRFNEMNEHSPNHAEYHDNIYCHKPEQTAAFMRDVKVPWIAFKVLAGGAISPTSGFEHALQNGADFMCVGMFDFQVAEDVQIMKGLFARGIKRERPWRG